MQRLAVINVVGLTKDHLGEHTPNITSLRNSNPVHKLDPPLPATTSTVQTAMLTGLPPCEHGIVANGWHERETNSTHFWRQSNTLVQGEMIWDAAKKLDPTFTCANMFWWFNMYSSVDIAVTPRPIYCANGRKIPDIWTNPSELRSVLQTKLGPFPLFNFWGPSANIKSSRWIIDATLFVEKQFKPSLMLVYVPHLDYSMQRVGPNHPSITEELLKMDVEVGKLIDHFTEQGIRICLLSEYGIDEVDNAIPINKVLRNSGHLAIREEVGREYLDAGQSEAFAVPDHQIAHIYIKDKRQIPEIASLLSSISCVEEVLFGQDRGELAHERCGDIVAVSDSRRWFSHDWWNDELLAPDYQQTVDIHRKPGYDPRELLLARGWRGSAVRIGLKLLTKKIGFRTRFDVITTDPSLVRGSHGRTPVMGATSPILIPPQILGEHKEIVSAIEIKNLMLDWLELS
ncbi:MAG: alkaline phosphatase family protein [Phycisphaerales bacterium]|nr:alkaline phosphatase family protein [Phycisphaerales bacterium]